MRIKIKNPDTAAHNVTLIITAALALLALAAAGAAICFANGPATAWNALGATIHDLCQDDLICNLGLSFLFKTGPFLIIGLFALCLWEKRTKFSPRRPGTYFTHITFEADGVLLEQPDQTKNLFFPYEKTSFDMTADVHQVIIKGSRVTAVSKVELAFTQTGGKPVALELLPPGRTMAFLCRILDKRSRFARFSYKVVPLSSSYATAAHTLSQKLESYCQTGFVSSFGSAGDRLFLAALGTAILLGSLYAFVSLSADFYFRGGLFLLVPLGAYFLFFSLKDLYLERKSRKK